MAGQLMRWTIMAAVAAAATGASAEPHRISGELVRISLVRQSVGVKVAGSPPREIEVRVAADTVMSARGRALRLADLRVGERIVVACTDDGGVHNARRIKLGGGRPR